MRRGRSNPLHAGVRGDTRAGRKNRRSDREVPKGAAATRSGNRRPRRPQVEDLGPRLGARGQAAKEGAVVARKTAATARIRLTCVHADWAEARVKIARVTLTIKLDRNWSSFQLANSAPPLSVTDSAIAPSARMPMSVIRNSIIIVA